MFSLSFCQPWKANDQNSQRSDSAERKQQGFLSLKRPDLLTPVAADISAARLTGTIKDIKDEMTKAGVLQKLPIALTDFAREQLVQAERDFASVSVQDIDDYVPESKKADISGAPEESKALREILFSLQILDFPLTEKDTFFVVQMLQRQDALSAGDLKGIFDAFGRMDLGAKSFATKVASFMNTPGLSEPLMFESARAYVEIINKRFPTMVPSALKDMCRQLDQPVRDKMADYSVHSRMLNPANIAISLKRPEVSEQQAVAVSPAQLNAASGPASGAASGNNSVQGQQRPAVRTMRPIRPVGQSKSVPLSHFYPRPALPTKAKLDR